MSSALAGLIVVHGIGNQKPGTVVGHLASSLAPGVEPAAASEEADPMVLEVEIGGRAVVMHEANWSGQSHPDNPPVLRNVWGIVPELYRTLGESVVRLSRPWREPGAEAGWVDWAWLGAMVLLTLGLFLPEDDESAEVQTFAGIELDHIYVVWGVLLVALSVHGFLVYIRAGTFGGLAASGIGRPIAWGLRAVLAVARVFALLMVMIFVPAYAVIVVALAPVYAAGAAVVALLRLTGRGLRWLRLGWAARWLYRLTWALIVFPLVSFVQTIKAQITLLSIVLTERSTATRIKAFAWLPAISTAAYLFLFLSVLILTVTYLGLDLGLRSGLGACLTLPALIVFWGLYLGALKLSVPMLDFLLDVANYHLAPQADRARYHEPIQRAWEALDARGCREIHLLAHSLGTVLAHDWLKSAGREAPSVASLTTIGSPLNKFWYVDRDARQRADPSGLSEKVRGPWLNYWAWSDPVSGALRHYDGPGLPVDNRQLRLGRLFPSSHVAYWDDERVLSSLRLLLAGGRDAVQAVE